MCHQKGVHADEGSLQTQTPLPSFLLVQGQKVATTCARLSPPRPPSRGPSLPDPHVQTPGCEEQQLPHVRGLGGGSFLEDSKRFGGRQARGDIFARLLVLIVFEFGLVWLLRRVDTG